MKESEKPQESQLPGAIRELEKHALSSVFGIERTLLNERSGHSVHFASEDISHPMDAKLNAHLKLRLGQTGLQVISEEDLKSVSIRNLPSSKYWLIDPIDGTYNMWRDLEFVSTSVALMKGSKPLFGVVKDLKNGDLYKGGITSVATKNEQPLAVSSTRSLQKAVLATGLPVHTFKSGFQEGLLEEGLEQVGKVRMYGSAALSLCRLAEGKIDVYWERGIFLWDIAAGLAIAQAAGAIVSCRLLNKGYRTTTRAQSPELGEFID